VQRVHIRRCAERDVVLVLGMRRSGASAVMRRLSSCGAQRLETAPANGTDAPGCGDPPEIASPNDAFLRAHGSSWYDGTFRLQTGLVGAAERADFVTQIGSFLRGSLEDDKPIVVSEPCLGALLPYWVAAAEALRLSMNFIQVFRQPREVATALAVHEGLLPAHAFALWLKYNLIAERDTRGAPRIFVSYERLFGDWEGVVARCAGALELDLRVEGDQRPLGGFLSRSLRCDGGATESGTPLPAYVSHVYDLLREAEAGAVDTAAFDAIRRDYVASREPICYALSCPL